jgi:hypothetical protein
MRFATSSMVTAQEAERYGDATRWTRKSVGECHSGAVAVKGSIGERRRCESDWEWTRMANTVGVSLERGNWKFPGEFDGRATVLGVLRCRGLNHMRIPADMTPSIYLFITTHPAFPPRVQLVLKLNVWTCLPKPLLYGTSSDSYLLSFLRHSITIQPTLNHPLLRELPYYSIPYYSIPYYYIPPPHPLTVHLSHHLLLPILAYGSLSRSLAHQSVLSAQFETTNEFGSLLRANTPVSRMMTTYTRRGPGQSYLKGVLADRINSLIEHKDLNLEINPLKVSRAVW